MLAVLILFVFIFFGGVGKVTCDATEPVLCLDPVSVEYCTMIPFPHLKKDLPSRAPSLRKYFSERGFLGSLDHSVASIDPLYLNYGTMLKR